jgi:hypothetical protein
MPAHREFRIKERRPDPTLQQIREQRLLIQSKWTPREELSRRHWTAEDHNTRCTRNAADEINRVEDAVVILSDLGQGTFKERLRAEEYTDKIGVDKPR